MKPKKYQKKRNKKFILLDNIKRGMKQVSQIEKKKIKSVSIEQLLHEL